MTDTLCQFFSWAVRDVIFFSGDVQTTTIAVAVAGSLCCSIVVAIVHVVALILPSPQRGKTPWRYHRSNSMGTLTSKKADSSIWISSGRVHVPCVKCGRYFADEGCRFVTCQSCCFSVLLCNVHQKKPLPSKPCDSTQTTLDLSSVGLRCCPKRLGFVGAQLTCLNLDNNKLGDLPPEIGCLRGLQRLCLNHNRLAALPVTLSSLTRLLSFEASHNHLTMLPDCVTSLSQLKELQVSHNRLRTLPPEIGRLKQLTFLDISCNKLEGLCDELFSMIKLKYLCVNSNKHVELPSAIGNLVKLHTLDLSNCSLTAVPHTLGKCSSLQHLNLSVNCLQRLPCQLGQLSELQLLQVSHNQLRHIPAIFSLLLDRICLEIKANPLLRKEEYSDYTQCPVPGQTWFPSLRELTAREIIRRNIPNTQTLPSVLQDMLKTVVYCSECGSPMFDVYSSQIIPWGGAYIPLYQQLCSPHDTQREHH